MGFAALYPVAYAPDLFPTLNMEAVAERCVVVFAIFTDAFLFVSGTAIIEYAFGVNYSQTVCAAAILFCISFNVTSKVAWPVLMILTLRPC